MPNTWQLSHWFISIGLRSMRFSFSIYASHGWEPLHTENKAAEVKKWKKKKKIHVIATFKHLPFFQTIRCNIIIKPGKVPWLHPWPHSLPVWNNIPTRPPITSHPQTQHPLTPPTLAPEALTISCQSFLLYCWRRPQSLTKSFSSIS